MAVRRHRTGRRTLLGAVLLTSACLGLTRAAAQPPPDPLAWTETEISVLRSLWIGSLPPLPPDPSNRVADDPRAVRLGHRLFFDTRLSVDGVVSCARCHVPARSFTDGEKVGLGVGTGGRNTITILGAAYSPWMFWDGRADSLWAQALGPMENPVEQAGTRTQYARLVATDRLYRRAYEALFGALPDLSDSKRFPPSAGPVPDVAARGKWDAMAAADRELVNRIFANIGKAIAAYERRIVPGPAPFDRYVAALLKGDRTGSGHLSKEAVAGLALFIGKGQCTQCHNGPLLTNFSFHNTGIPPVAGKPPDRGRLTGVKTALADPFNCLGRHSDAGKEACAELRFAKTEGADLDGAMKTPTLRNVSKTGPYMHAGQFATLAAVLDHYNRAPAAATGKTELHPLRLSPAELRALEAFLRALDSPPAMAPELLRPPD